MLRFAAAKLNTDGFCSNSSGFSQIILSLRLFKWRWFCLKERNERETPRICPSSRFFGRLEGSGAVSKSKMSEKRPEFAPHPDFLGVLKEAALSQGAK
jgi:hypothetical protein